MLNRIRPKYVQIKAHFTDGYDHVTNNKGTSNGGEHRVVVMSYTCKPSY